MSDPRQTLALSRMSVLQITVVAITVFLNALDGYDVLAIAFASPGITAEWGLGPQGIGIVLTMELIGMAVGSVLLGGMADRIGRRTTVLWCLTVMALGMYMATTTTSLAVLSVWRVITGLGIGGMLAAINAVAAEFSNAKNRYFSVSLMAIGYPLGGVFGGTIAVMLLQSHDWRSVFYLGAIATAVFLPIVYFLVPESVSWLVRKQPPGALQAVNKTLRRMGHQPIEALPPLPKDEVSKGSLGDIFSPALLRTTLLVTIAYFFHIMAFYFLIKWIPQIATQMMGFTTPEGGSVLRWTMLGGALGGAIVGLLTLRFGIKLVTVTVLVGSAVMLSLFGSTSLENPELTRVIMICAATGLLVNGAIVGLFGIFAKAFPTHVRAFGTGFAIGIGRGASVIGPPAAGALFAAGFTLQFVAVAMATGCLIAALALSFVKLNPKEVAD